MIEMVLDIMFHIISFETLLGLFPRHWSSLFFSFTHVFLYVGSPMWLASLLGKRSPTV
jgi:hypothetical protein